MDSPECDVEDRDLGRRCDVDTGRCFTPCEDGAICGRHGQCDVTAGRCIPRCRADSECAEGLLCTHDGRCRPPCISEDDCAGGRICDYNTGRCEEPCRVDEDCRVTFICHPRTGRCYRDCSLTPVGEPCRSDRACGPHGTCLRPDSGFPEGYCSCLGCSERERCPSGSECLPAAVGELGQMVPACFDACEETEECRAGYVCSDEAGPGPTAG